MVHKQDAVGTDRQDVLDKRFEPEFFTKPCDHRLTEYSPRAGEGTEVREQDPFQLGRRFLVKDDEILGVSTDSSGRKGESEIKVSSPSQDVHNSSTFVADAVAHLPSACLIQENQPCNPPLERPVDPPAEGERTLGSAG